MSKAPDAAPATRRSSAGKIFAEYWVDCFGCRDAVPCATNRHGMAAYEARRLGWRRLRTGWHCPRCLEGIKYAA